MGGEEEGQHESAQRVTGPFVWMVDSSLGMVLPRMCVSAHRNIQRSFPRRGKRAVIEARNNSCSGIVNSGESPDNCSD